MTDLSWTKRPPALLNPEEALAAQRVIAREHSVPRGQDKLGELRDAYREEFASPPKRLDPELAWVFPALAYCMMGLDKSLFELFSWARDAIIDVVSYQSPVPLATFNGADISKNRWFYTVQGIPRELHQEFVDYIQTYRFDDNPRQLAWRLVAYTVRVADPFASRGSERIGTDITLMLPECLTTQRCVMVTRVPGLRLDSLELGMAVSPERPRA